MKTEETLKKTLNKIINKQPKLTRTLRKIRDRFYDEQPLLLVAGPPRSGFTLLISILNQLLSLKRFKRVPLRDALTLDLSMSPGNTSVMGSVVPIILGFPGTTMVK